MNARVVPLLGCLLLGLAAATARSAEAKAEADPAAAFTKQRMEFAKTQEFETGATETRNAIRALAGEGKLEEAAKKARAWLAKHPVDASTHMLLAAILLEGGDYQGYLRHRFVGQGLLASIAASGSGRSQETAMKVINVDEEYAVLRSLGAKLKKQALVSGEGGRQYDRMTCDIRGKEVTLYFDVTLWMQTIRKGFNLEPEEEKKKEDPEKKPATPPPGS